MIFFFIFFFFIKIYYVSNTVPLFVLYVWHRIQEPGHHTNLHKVSEDWLVLYYVVITENNIDKRMNTIFC